MSRAPAPARAAVSDSTLRRARPLLLVLALLLARALGAGAAEPGTVVMISMDGVRHDLPGRARTPALDRMAREGARAAALVPVFPSSTFPNHVALATGAHADRHGVVANHFLDSERGEFRYGSDASFLEAEPLWAAAERQGVRAAVFFWVGSETDWRGVGASYRESPFDSGVGEAEKVERILAWLDLPPAERPRLVLAWWHGADHAGHAHGPESEAAAAALGRQDAHLARLLEGLDAREAWGRTTLLVVSDHGMARVSRAVDLRARLAERGIGARVLSGGGFAHVHLDERADREAALAALSALPEVRVWPGRALPERLHYDHPRRMGDLVALTTPPRVFARREGPWQRLAAGLLRWVGAGARGAHGYDPELPSMHGILYALGRGVPSGARLEAQRAVDVAPTAAALLGIDPPAHAEGRPIPALGPER